MQMEVAQDGLDDDRYRLAPQERPDIHFDGPDQILSRKRPQDHFDQQVRNQICVRVVSSSPVMPR